MTRPLAHLLSLFVCFVLMTSAARGDALVLGGETIADDALMTAAKAEREADIYGIMPTDAMMPVFEKFEKDTGLKLKYVRMSTTVAYDRVLAEFAGGKLTSDYADQIGRAHV